jgi:glycosyltransferase involved in cell wall biosynthesis
VAAPDKFVTIHSGIRVDRFLDRNFAKEDIRSDLNIPSQSRVVGTVARLEPVKGVDYFLESMREVLDRMPDVHFLIVGDGSQRKALQDRARELGIENNITFTGIRDDVPSLMSIMDLFVLPSLNEGMGRVLVEAGLMAKPAVATKVSGIPELVKHQETGILVEPRSSKELASGIIELLSKPQQAHYLGQNAKSRMAENFSAQSMVDKIEALYKDLLLSKQGRV